MKNLLITVFVTATLFSSCGQREKINRQALVQRNSPHLTAFDTLASLSVGNGGFAFTVDVTGLQTFQEAYTHGVPLGTQSDWGWHSYGNPEKYRHEETLKDYDFGRGKQEPYSIQFKEKGRNQDAANWYRVNPHRLHLGVVGFDGLQQHDISEIDQTLDMWNGVIDSKFKLNGESVEVKTLCHPEQDVISAMISNPNKTAIALRFPYPTGGHSDDACDWSKDDRHSTTILETRPSYALIERRLDQTVYYVTLQWQGDAAIVASGRNKILLTPQNDSIAFSIAFSDQKASNEQLLWVAALSATTNYWNNFWSAGAAVDFSRCTDPRAKELERRVVLSQYLLAIQCAGDTPPQETGLTYNSWFGKFHLEMIWWHQAQFALWGHADLLKKSLKWYHSAAPVAKEIATRQGFKGLRWMKMTDPSALEAPSRVGSFLTWQQPHLIYLAELAYRAEPDSLFLEEYFELVQQTAQFMYSFATYEQFENRVILKGTIPAQETLSASTTINPPFELAYWHYALSVAQQWRERMGLRRDLQWDEMIDKLSPLASKDGLYLAAENAEDTYIDIKYTSDHMAVLGAMGVIPKTPLVRTDYMANTLNWVYDNWNWGKTWGWDYPMTAMCAVRLGEPEMAINSLLMEKRTNTYLPNGHNYQDARLRCYLPGNGGLLTTVALMCAGWDGCSEKNPGFPKNGKWDVLWEGLKPMP